MRTTNYFYLAISLIVIASFTSCEKNENPNLPEIEPGRFKGNIGRHGYDLVNDKFNERLSTTHFDNENFQFQFNSDASPSIIDGNFFDSNQILTVNLVNPFNTSSFLFFETYEGSKNYNQNWITVDWFEQWKDQKTENFYTTVKGKKSVEIEILSVKYKKLKVPSLEIKINGYLYNIKNREDSILIDAALSTQASY